MLILGIESSCDETAAAVLADGNRLLSNIVHSQIDTHGKYGGVVPELASRKHMENIYPVVQEALKQAGVSLNQLDGLAVVLGGLGVLFPVHQDHADVVVGLGVRTVDLDGSFVIGATGGLFCGGLLAVFGIVAQLVSAALRRSRRDG